jgi:hypothetical protein
VDLSAYDLLLDGPTVAPGLAGVGHE